MSAADRSLKKIAVDQVALGMFLRALDGPWLDHPFWKTSFVLTDPADLARLRQSKVRAVWIDTDRGADVGPTAASSSDATPDDRPLPAEAAAPDQGPELPPAMPPPPSASMQDELQVAAQVCKRSREAVSSMFSEVRLGRALDAERCLPLVDEITDSVYRNPGALVSLARLKTADDYSYMHSVAVCALMVALGREMGLSDAACREAGLAGLMHDLGKAMMPLAVLNKPGKLTDDEFALMRTHPRRGWELLAEARTASEAMLDVCLHHHERVDGTGYPERLDEAQISPLARMGAVCDVYDAVTSNRPYKAGWDPSESMARMASWQGHFDERILHAFVRSLGIYPNGALVRLASGRLAVVMAQNPQALTAPVVKVFFDTRTEMPVAPSVLDLARSGLDKIVDREPPGRWNFPHLNQLWAGEDVLRRSR